jgi:hypothetical protein
MEQSAHHIVNKRIYVFENYKLIQEWAEKSQTVPLHLKIFHFSEKSSPGNTQQPGGFAFIPSGPFSITAINSSSR